MTKDTRELIERLEYYNKWRRGADTEQPDPKQLGRDIDMAIKLLKSYDRDVRDAYIKGSNDCHRILMETQRECKENEPRK